MADRIKGITIEIDGSTTKLQSALKAVNSDLNNTSKSLKDVNKLLKLEPGNTDLLKQKQELLTRAISDTESKLKTEREALAQLKSADQTPEITAQMEALERQIADDENQLKSFKEQAKDFGSVFKQQIKAAGESLKEVGKDVSDVGDNLTKKVTVPLVALGTGAVKVGMDFDSAMSQVAATMGMTADEMSEVGGHFEKLRNFAKEMGATTAFSASQAAEALNYMALAGYDASTSMQMLPTVLNLAAAGNMDLAKASDMVTDTQTAFGISLERTAQMVDEMAKAASTGNTSVEQLGTAFLTVGGLAKELNGGMVTLADGTRQPVDGVQELEIALTAMANAGIKGSEAGTHMRNMLLKLSSPTSEGTKQLEALGVQVFDTEGNMRSLNEIFGDLGVSLSSLTQQEKLQAISDLFNTRDIASAEALLTAVGEDWDTIGEAILNAEGAAATMADTQLNNLQGSLTMLKSALEGAAIAISDVVVPAIRSFTEWINNLVTKFNELSPETQTLVVKIGVIVAAIGPLLAIGGRLITGIGNLLIYGPMLVSAISAIASPVGIAVAAIAALVAIGVVLYKNWDTICEWANKLKDTVVNAWNATKESVTKTVEDIKSKVTEKWNSLKSSVSTAAENIKTGVSNTWNNIKSTVSSVQESINSYVGDKLNAIKSAYEENGGGLKGIASATMEGIRQYYQTGWDAINTLTGGRLSEISSVISEKMNSAKETVHNVLESIRSGFAEKLEGARQTVSSAIEAIKGIFNFSWSLPHISLPHFSVSGKFSLNPPSIPHFSVSWYRKAYDNAMMFTSPTVIPTSSGLKGFGDGNGAEIVLGMNKLRELVGGTGNTTTINIYPQDGQSAYEIAQEVDRILTHNANSTRAVWA